MSLCDSGVTDAAQLLINLKIDALIAGNRGGGGNDGHVVMCELSFFCLLDLLCL